MADQPGFLLKLGRAVHHLEHLDSLVRGIVEKCQESVRSEPDANRPGYVRIVVSAEQPGADPLSLVIGECLHNMRSALDLLAYELASRHTQSLPDEFAETSEFPIFGDEDRQGQRGIGSARFHERSRSGNPTRRSGLIKIRGINPAAQAVIERAQPYHRGPSFRDDPLWKLHDLDRVNKHRLLHVSIIQAGGMVLDIPPDYSVQRDWPFGTGAVKVDSPVIETDTEVGSFPLRPGMDYRDMRVKIYPAIEIAFDASTPNVEHQPVVKVLAEIHNHIRSVVMRPLLPYL